MEEGTHSGERTQVCGLKLGRFVLLEPVGAGSMGFVFSAYDPELDRKVAIKLLRTDTTQEEGARLLAESTIDSWTWGTEQPGTQDGPDAYALDSRQQRLLREARAMAQLNHPNVVTVYEVGTHGRDVFIAMQFIQGLTLRDWIAKTCPGWKEILGVYRQAGAGLAEAHRQGMIHRDFKPDNVMIDEKGCAYVLDFGLVRSSEAMARKDLQQAVRNLEPEVSGTATGSALGTPAYMSPEQLHGRSVDARSDQFSFCVSLYEALCRQRPFNGSSIEELGASMERGVAQTPRSGPAPAWVWQAVHRGLHAQPEQRWPTMDDLLERIARDPRAGRKAMFRVAAVLMALGLAIVIMLHFFEVDRPPDCSLAAERLEGSWDAGIRNRGREAFAVSKKPYAQASWKHVEASIDQYANAWVQAQQEVCEATYVFHKQSETLLDLRMACLDQRLAALHTLGKLLVEADSETIERAADMVGRLPGLAICSNTTDLLAPTPLPAKQEYREEIQRARKQLAIFAVSIRRGEHDKVLEQLNIMEKRAREMGYQPILAEILLAKSRLLFELQEMEKSEETCWDALVASLAGNHRHLITMTLVEMVRVEGSIYGKAKAYAFSSLAHARIQGTHADRELDLKRIQYLVDALLFHLDPVDALHIIEPARERFERHYGARSLANADFLAAHAQTLFYMDQLTESLDLYDEALSIYEEKLGATHPHLIAHYLEIAEARNRNADPQGAREAMKAAQEALETLSSASDQMRIRFLAAWGEVYSCLGKTGEAIDAFKQALSLAEKQTSAEWLRAFTYLRYGEHQLRHQNLEDAFVLGQKSMRAYERAVGKKSIDLFMPSYLLGEVELERGNARDAEKHFRRIVSLIGTRSRKAPAIAHGLTGLGESLMAQGKSKEATEVLERAYRLRRQAPGYYWSRPRTSFALASALLASGGDPERAARLATEAFEEFSRVASNLPWDRALKKRMGKLVASLKNQ